VDERWELAESADGEAIDHREPRIFFALIACSP
jgi:hypothetical protein